jgi:peptidoglycan/xylan/chitin deacetylase (PgdA/CDA1 family)
MFEERVKSKEIVRMVNDAKSLGEHSRLDLSRLGGKVFCLTLDVEQDFGARLGFASYEGMVHIPKLVDLLKRRDIPLTCFMQGSILETHQAEIEPFFTLDVEFELHSYSHPKKEELDIQREVEEGKRAYFNFFKRNPRGYRSPLGIVKEEDYDILSSAGFAYDSSIFPTFRPGIFNNLKKPITPVFCGLTSYPGAHCLKLYQVTGKAVPQHTKKD